jgi:hypothetical protein
MAAEPPKLEKAEPWWAQRKALHDEDIALLLDWMAFGYGASVATSQPVVAFSHADDWLLGNLSWRTRMLSERSKFSFHEMSPKCFDCAWVGFVACQCALSLAGSTKTESADRGKRTFAFGGHCVIASAERKQSEIQVSSSIRVGGQPIPKCRGARVD